MEQLKITQNDPYLAPFEQAIVGRHNYAIAREKEIKAWRREKKDKLIATTNPEKKDLAIELEWV